MKNNKMITVSLTQILENGIWQMEAEFNNSYNIAAIGIVRDTYNIPADTHPYCQHMVSYGMINFGETVGNGKVYYKENGTSGNIAYQDNQIIKSEYDSEKGTLIFSVDGVQQPVYVRGINEKVRFIIFIYYPQASCTIRSLKKLITPTTKHVANEKVKTMKLISEIGKSLKSIPDTLAQVYRLPFLKEQILAEIKQAKVTFTEFVKSGTCASSAAKSISKQTWKEIYYIERTLLPIFDIRSKELSQCLSQPDNAWV
ncbi:MAG: hypothetical protein EZS28_039593, partial [Streblomastix strix]